MSVYSSVLLSVCIFACLSLCLFLCLLVWKNLQNARVDVSKSELEHDSWFVLSGNWSLNRSLDRLMGRLINPLGGWIAWCLDRLLVCSLYALFGRSLDHLIGPWPSCWSFRLLAWSIDHSAAWSLAELIARFVALLNNTQRWKFCIFWFFSKWGYSKLRNIWETNFLIWPHLES